jgi:hypothetical protein
MRVLALGSCRIHEPLIAAEDAGQIEYLNRRFKRNRPVYLHDINEAIQFVRLIRGEIAMPKAIRRFAYERGLRVDTSMIRALERAEYVVLEVCTDKHYEVGNWTLSVNELHRRVVQAATVAAQEWWDATDRGLPRTEAQVLRVEAELRTRWWRRWQFDDSYRQVLRQLAFRYLSAAEIAQGLARLRALLHGRILVVPHVAVQLPDGEYLAERLQHVNKTIEAVGKAGLPYLDPRTFVSRDGQNYALDSGGRDYHHYAAAYIPIVGQEIIRSIRVLDGKIA